MRVRWHDMAWVLLVVVIVAVVAAGGRAATQGPSPPAHWLVLMRVGPAYDPAVPIGQQRTFAAHAAYMSELERTGRLVYGGPLLDSHSTMRVTGAVLIVRADTRSEAERLGATDPSGLLVVEEVRAFLPSVGAR